MTEFQKLADFLSPIWETRVRIPLLRFQNLIGFYSAFGILTSLWVRNMFPELYLRDLNETLCLIFALCFCLIEPDSLWGRKNLALGMDLLKINIQPYLLLFSAFLYNNHTSKGISIGRFLLSSS